MKKGFYPKLALGAMEKNGKLYIPYILTCIGMVMMFYIVSFLSTSKNVSVMPGGKQMQFILVLGCGVIGFFSLIFLFYTNSFLMRKRKKEFGLYNILGMGKRNIARILLWESLFITFISLTGGLLCGILFSKIGELLMARILGGKINFKISIGAGSVIATLILFAVIFFLILINALRQIHVAKPVELLQSDTIGEKPPKSNWIVAFLGAVVLAAAYYIAVSIKQPVIALLWFFVAVIMVIAATYMLFVAGSVVLCRLLQKNKHYYYKANHFVWVSSMLYRMKRNGAGLASICILSTMVLVMISTTVCLYVGADASLHDQYPRNIDVDISSTDTKYTGAVDKIIDGALRKKAFKPKNALRYNYIDFEGFFNGNRLDFNPGRANGRTDDSNERQMFIISLADYNRMSGTNENLTGNEALVYCTKSRYDYDTIDIHGKNNLKIVKNVPKFVSNVIDTTQIFPSMFVVVRDFSVIENSSIAENSNFKYHCYNGFDLSCGDSAQIALQKSISSSVETLYKGSSVFPRTTVESVAAIRPFFIAFYGGLLFLGVLLGIVFICGAVLIMYYKQISEGYEDKSRFDIMQKVGMTKKEIRKSVDSQVLTVFFLPLAVAGIHLTFAFPMISKMLALLDLRDIGMLIALTAACFIGFAIFYILVYALTSRSYYKIVSNKEDI